MERNGFPFVAVSGQEELKQALLWNLVNPAVGGLLICGEKGTAKSTLVRGLPAFLRGQRLVELPLNITEDRLVGSIDLTRALADGQSTIQPGILYEADGNILYADEVNLLGDHIVNALLQAAAEGQNVVEREGISFVHESRFVLIGSMNPEEGRLRPQFLDRFGLYVEVRGERDPAVRVEIMKRRLDYERNPMHFIRQYQEETERLRKKLQEARKLLPEVEVTENAGRLAASLSEQLHCAGHRGERAALEAARAIAALDGRRMLTADDIREAAKYALAHRARNEERFMQQEDARKADGEKPEDRSDEPDAELKNPLQEQEDADMPDHMRQPEPAAGQTAGAAGSGANLADREENLTARTEDDVQESGEAFIIPRWEEPPALRNYGHGVGKRELVKSDNRQGRYVAYRITGREKVTDLAFDATVRAAAPYQRQREKNGRAVAIEKSDLRVKIRERRTGGCILFVVDASASMGANRRMREVKAAVVSLLNVSYQKRDRVGMIAFRGDSAALLLGITRSVDLAQKKLAELPTGGKTPLAAGLNLAYEILMGLKMREPETIPTLVLVSDGRANGKKSPGSDPFGQALQAAERIGNQKIHTILLDTETGFLKFHLCAKLNEKLHGTLLTMEELRAEGIVEAVSLYSVKNSGCF